MYAHHMDTAHKFINQDLLQGYKNSQGIKKDLEDALAEACDAVIKTCVDAFGKPIEI